jgi:2-iminobutanoate/2-iminopropanoate deaminase
MTDMKEVRSAHVAAPTGPYSQATKSGSLVFTSGQGGSGDIRSATREALEKIKAIVEAAGGTLDSVARVMIFVADFSDYAAVNEVYGVFFSQPVKPARVCVQAVLPPGVVVEMDAVAVL